MSFRATLLILLGAALLPSCVYKGMTVGYAYTDGELDGFTGEGAFRKLSAEDQDFHSNSIYGELHFGLADGQEKRDQDALRALRNLRGAMDGIRGDLAVQRLLEAQGEDPEEEQDESHSHDEGDESTSLGVVVGEGHEDTAEEPTRKDVGQVLADRWAEALASLLALWVAYSQRVAIGRVARKAVGRGEPEE